MELRLLKEGLNHSLQRFMHSKHHAQTLTKLSSAAVVICCFSQRIRGVDEDLQVIRFENKGKDERADLPFVEVKNSIRFADHFE